MIFYKYLFIFACFSIIGWIIELIYRSLIEKKIVNPGFMSGCVVPLYGIFLNLICILFSSINTNYKIFMIFILSIIVLTLLEFICGYISLKYFHIRLWDYRKQKFNYKGLICIRFSIIWGLLSVLYYLVVYHHINNISINFISSTNGIFALGIFLGIFIIDLSISIKLFNRLIKYAKSIIVSYIKWAEIEENINIEKLKLEARINNTRKKFFSAIYPYLSTNRYVREKLNELKKKNKSLK